jgi:hypothetical protein
MLSNNQYFLFSVYRTDDALNIMNHELTKQHLSNTGIAFIECNSRYEGINEKCFLVDARHETKVNQLSKDFNQDSVLFIDALNNATLIYKDGTIDKLGAFKRVDRDNATKKIAYTQIGDQFYTTF